MTPMHTHRQILGDRLVFSEGSLRGGREAAKQVCPHGIGKSRQPHTTQIGVMTASSSGMVCSFRAPGDG